MAYKSATDSFAARQSKSYLMKSFFLRSLNNMFQITIFHILAVNKVPNLKEVIRQAISLPYNVIPCRKFYVMRHLSKVDIT